MSQTTDTMPIKLLNVTPAGDYTFTLPINGASVTQLTSKTTTVTINAKAGSITTHNAALAAGAEAKFTVNNSFVGINDIPFVSIRSGGTSGSYLICVSAVGNGTFDIVISNCSAGSLSQALVINFRIFKGSTT